MTPDEAYETALTAIKRVSASDPRLKMMAVARAVEDATGYTLAEMRGDRRFLDLVVARHEAWLLCHEMGVSTCRNGAFWDRDHTSIMNGIRRAKQRRKERESA